MCVCVCGGGVTLRLFYYYFALHKLIYDCNVMNYLHIEVFQRGLVHTKGKYSVLYCQHTFIRLTQGIQIICPSRLHVARSICNLHIGHHVIHFKGRGLNKTQVIFIAPRSPPPPLHTHTHPHTFRSPNPLGSLNTNLKPNK